LTQNEYEPITLVESRINILKFNGLSFGFHFGIKTMRFHLILLLCFQPMISALAVTYDPCDPLILIQPADSSLKVLLSRLADEYDFQLFFPDSLDRPVKFMQSMPLSLMIKKLTMDMNTVLMHEALDNCGVPKLTFFLALPEAVESDNAISLIHEQVVNEDYIYIENMNLYVSQVLDGSQVAEIHRMTPEQLFEYEQLVDALQANPKQAKIDTDAVGN